MGLQDFRKGRDEGAGPVAPSTSQGVGALTAFIDQGSEFTGKLSFKDTVRIDGHFEGEISSDNTLIVGEAGVIHANISSNVVVISGTVEGEIRAGRQVTLHKTAVVTGNLKTQSLLIEEGAKLNGHVDMGSDAKKADAPKDDKRPALSTPPGGAKPPSA